MKTENKFQPVKKGTFEVRQARSGQFDVVDTQTGMNVLLIDRYSEALKAASDLHATRILSGQAGIDTTATLLRNYGGIDAAMAAWARYRVD